MHQVVRERLQVIDHQREVFLPPRDARRQIVLEGAPSGTSAGTSASRPNAWPICQARLVKNVTSSWERVCQRST